jgi:hypothetical protein
MSKWCGWWPLRDLTNRSLLMPLDICLTRPSAWSNRPRNTNPHHWTYHIQVNRVETWQEPAVHGRHRMISYILSLISQIVLWLCYVPGSQFTRMIRWYLWHAPHITAIDAKRHLISSSGSIIIVCSLTPCQVWIHATTNQAH